MKKKCNCECHQLHPVPCMFCAGRHVDQAETEPVEPFEEVHDDKTEPVIWPTLDDEGFPF